ncbi:MAG TPA: class I SAM-dependent methyltransferase [Ignavibacteriaceae bacterium]|nr:class I SAM-dependent methyltransferase [Ignavibacteriaceae bacterium]
MEKKKIKEFWDNRAKSYNPNNLSVTNLESNAELEKLKVKMEREKLSKIIRFNKNSVLLDLGCGIGAWSEYFSSNFKKIVGVEYSKEMIKIAIERQKLTELENIEFQLEDSVEFMTETKFDVIFISGLILYLMDSELEIMIKNMNKYSKMGTQLILREPVGILGRHEIVNKYSEALKVYYSAIYRTDDEFVAQFRKIGFELDFEDFMFPDGSELNKWKETRLKIFSFLKKV